MDANYTFVTEFVLLSFPHIRELEVFLFIMIFIIYVLTLMGNMVIIILICTDYRLHTPMYFFLGNFSFMEILITSVVVPKMLQNLLSKKKSISFAGCITQSYFYFFLGGVEFILIAAMSFDRYSAICNPLHYNNVMTGRVCVHIVVCSWLGGFFSNIFSTIMMTRLPFCGPNVINHFFCDSAPLLRLTCISIQLFDFIEFLNFIFSTIVIITSLLVTVVAYAFISVTILRLPSLEERQRAFSTCATHITMAVLGYGSTIFLYVRPAKSTSVQDKLVALLNTIVTPALNPFIFSLRNKMVKDVARDAYNKSLLFFKNLRKLGM
ncbi:olfactory receptor 6M1-like [Elgaria multicarinata webbii]|uniref:olfactory receptor 6M1-like n=1 Tax=Elgaria multicarinata webbii TaxID=159646 RepID=UPI002FCCE329